MSIADLDKIDAIGTDKNEKALRLMISDHMDWEFEDIHIEILQDKLNMYLQYIESKQYVEKYGDEFEHYYIDIYFKENITKDCFAFLEEVSMQLEVFNVYINMHFD